MKNLTIQKTTLVIVFALLFAIALRVPVDADTWWHVHSGGYTLSNGMAYSDPFSHTFENEAWVNSSWGSQIVMFGFWKFAGYPGLAFFGATLALASMGLVYSISAGNVYLRAFILILGSTSAAIFWAARPQMISFFFSAFLLYLLYKHKQDGRDWLWAIIPLMWIWSGFHAGWMVGYLFLIAFIVGELFNNLTGIDENTMSWASWRKLVIATLISVPFIALSPYFLNNMLVPFNTVNIEPLRGFIQEWQSPNFQGSNTWPFIAMIMLMFMALWTSKLKFDWSGFFLLIGTFFLALLYGRNIALFTLVATPILTHHLDNALTERNIILRPRRSVPPTIAIINLTLIVLVISSVGLYTFGLLMPENIEATQSEVLPVSAVDYLNENDLPREMFNSYNWGGYLMFAAPDYPVFVDGRIDMYLDFVIDYASIYFDNVDDLEAELEAYNINLVLVEVVAPINDALAESDNWTLEYEDELAVIWLRSNNNE